MIMPKRIRTKEQKDRRNACWREWYKKNSDRVLAHQREWQKKNRDRINASRRERMKKNRDKVNSYLKQRWNKNPELRLTHNLRRSLNRYAKSCSIRSSERFGCTPKQLRDHIEAKFERDMTWENYGEWHIDHIMPCSAFDLTNPDHVKVCFNWQNLRPLWAKENRLKGNKITNPQFNLPLVK